MAAAPIRPSIALQTLLKLWLQDLPEVGWMEELALNSYERSAADTLVENGLAIAHFEITLFEGSDSQTSAHLSSRRKATLFLRSWGRGWVDESLRRAREWARNDGYDVFPECRVVVGGKYFALSGRGSQGRAEFRATRSVGRLSDWLHTCPDPEIQRCDWLDAYLPPREVTQLDEKTSSEAFIISEASFVRVTGNTRNEMEQYFDMVDAEASPSTADIASQVGDTNGSDKATAHTAPQSNTPKETGKTSQRHKWDGVAFDAAEAFKKHRDDGGTQSRLDFLGDYVKEHRIDAKPATLNEKLKTHREKWDPDQKYGRSKSR